MKNKLHLVQKSVLLTCNWVPTGDTRMPLACVWTGSTPESAISDASSTDEPGRMHSCA
jgi:hypothetical protein